MNVSTMLGAAGQGYAARSGNIYRADGSGLITGYTTPQGVVVTGISTADITDLLNDGATYATLRTRVHTPGIVAVASATVIVASGALSNGSMTIAAQPDCPRQLAVVMNSGATITAGTLTLVYNNTEGQPSTDAFSLAVTGSVASTFVTSQGCSHLTSGTVAGLAGGTSPNIKVGTNNVLALPADLGQSSLTVFYASVDGAADSALPTQSAANGHLITPATAPNGTHTYSFGYNFFSA